MRHRMKAYNRCGWCGTDPLYVAYHDHEWGRPERDARALSLLALQRRAEVEEQGSVAHRRAVIHDRVNGRMRKKRAKVFQNFFRAAMLHKIIVY